MKRGVDAILCDVGGVVILFDPAVSMEIEHRHGIKPGTLLNLALKSSASRLAMIGGISQSAWRAEMEGHIPLRAVDDWLAYHGDVNGPVVRLLTAVRVSGIRLVLLSNATSRLWDDLAEHQLLDLADDIYCSSDMGVAKPDPKAYSMVIDAAGLSPSRTLYIDDTASWVDTGRTLGMMGHVYRSPSGLADDLILLGAFE